MKTLVKNIKDIKEFAVNEETRFEFQGSSYFIEASVIWVNGLCTVSVHNAINEEFSKQLWSAFISDLKKGAEITVINCEKQEISTEKVEIITEENYLETAQDDAEPTSRVLEEDNDTHIEYSETHILDNTEYQVFYIFEKKRNEYDYDFCFENIARVELIDK